MAPAANKGISNNINPDMMVLVTRNKGTGRTIPNNPNDKTKGAIMESWKSNKDIRT